MAKFKDEEATEGDNAALLVLNVIFRDELTAASDDQGQCILGLNACSGRKIRGCVLNHIDESTSEVDVALIKPGITEI
jgi:hypothetical protein